MLVDDLIDVVAVGAIPPHPSPHPPIPPSLWGSTPSSLCSKVTVFVRLSRILGIRSLSNPKLSIKSTGKN